MRKCINSLLVLAVAAVLFACGTSANGNDSESNGAGASGNSANAGPDGSSAGAGSDAGFPSTIPIDGYGGHCDAAFPQVAKVDFNNSSSLITSTSGFPDHLVRDIILAPGQAGQVTAHFSYGLSDLALAGERIDAFIQVCPDWQSLGTYTTDANGEVTVDMPDLPKGDYQVRLVVVGDLTTADGMVAIWPRGVQAIVTDLDATLTTDDTQSALEFTLGIDAGMNTDADTVMQTWRAKNYRIVYLSGRLRPFGHSTHEWLARHAFPPGILRITDRTFANTPTDQDTQDFKTNFLVTARDENGVSWIAAYGNALTDIAAYEASSIPKSETFIIGAEAGQQNTVALTSFTDHLPELSAYSDAQQP